MLGLSVRVVGIRMQESDAQDKLSAGICSHNLKCYPAAISLHDMRGSILVIPAPWAVYMGPTLHLLAAWPIKNHLGRPHCLSTPTAPTTNINLSAIQNNEAAQQHFLADISSSS